MKLRRALIVLALLAAACAAAPAAAFAAAPSLTAPADKIDFAAGTVKLTVEYPAGTSSIALTAAGQPLQTIAIADTTLAGTVDSDPIALKAATPFTAQGFDGSQQSVWGPLSVKLTPAALRPAPPGIALKGGSLIGSPFTLMATTSRPATRYLIRASGFEDSVLRGTCTTTAGGTVALVGLRLPYGPERVRLWLANGFGISASPATVSLYQLGAKSKLPTYARYVLVDKRSLMLFDISAGRVVRSYPVAVGTPYTPTPNGYFKLGKAVPASGPWGVLRRPLYRFSGGTLRATGYYIHGTNEPWSIGTMASHGCVRMYNADIRRVARYVPVWTIVFIR